MRISSIKLKIITILKIFPISTLLLSAILLIIFYTELMHLNTLRGIGRGIGVICVITLNLIPIIVGVVFF